MSYTPQNRNPRRDFGASKVKNQAFRRNDRPYNAPEGDDDRPIQKSHGRNQLKLNEFHQRVNTTHKVSTKKKMRDITRLLAKKEGGDAALKESKEQQLKDLKKKHREDRKRRYQTMANEKKYKKIKFFEEQKLKRKLKSAQNKIKAIETGQENTENNLEELQQERQRIVEDLDYIKYYPMNHKYIALFPTVDDEEAQEKREAMRKIVKNILAKRAINLQMSLQRLTDEMNQDSKAKDDTFFEMEEEPETEVPKKKKLVDKSGRIINTDF